VDDAIVDVENIFRRLKENNASAKPRPAIRVVYDASREVRNAIVFGTMVVILVFLPLLGIGGVVGRLSGAFVLPVAAFECDATSG